jgi:large subunit ribosomal protein L21
MYAVIESGNKQYRVELGSEIQVDHLDVQAGDSITLDRVLLVADGDATAIGQPVVDGATVLAEVLRQERGEKIVVFKYKPKARTRVKKGFRAELTTLRIADIAFGGKSAAKDAKASAARKAKADKAAADKELAAKLAAASEPVAEAETAESKPKAPSKKSTPKASAKKPAAEAEASSDTEPAPEAQGDSDVEDTKKDG